VTRSALFDIVVPTVGRPSLARLLESLARQMVPPPGRVLVVDDRRDHTGPLPGVDGALADRVLVVPGPGRGPAAARNAGWRAATAEWVAFLDDDVVAPAWWAAVLLRDLRFLAADVGASEGRIRVPLPEDRRPSDWERNVGGLERARWATADMAYRRRVLERVGGFDERFPRPYREDADLGLRVLAAGYRIERGTREVRHPVRPADPWISVRLQVGNADDALMSALHGRRWREEAGAPPGRRRRHGVTVALAAAAVVAAALGATGVAVAFGAGWLLATAELAWARIAPGPRTPGEVATMVATSVVLPFVAIFHWVAGLVRARLLAGDRRAVSWRDREPSGARP
jgi:hypothetical protein